VVKDGGTTAHGRAPIALSAACLGWARTAHYIAIVADDGEFQLRSEAGAPNRYFIRRRGSGRLELTQADEGAAEHPLLFVAEIDVLERYLVGMFADDIREDLNLPMLELSCRTEDLANGYELSEMVRGYRTLRRTLGGPVAAAPDPTLSMLALVPLSHYLRWSISDLKRAFLSPEGTPLLLDGHYVPQ
jgi:Immunity protein 61